MIAPETLATALRVAQHGARSAMEAMRLAQLAQSPAPDPRPAIAETKDGGSAIDDRADDGLRP